MRTLVALSLGFVSFAITSNASALRCGTRLINVGDSQIQVQQLCGEPADKSLRVVERTVQQQFANQVVARTVVTRIEAWTFNFGPQRLMQRVEFEDGLVCRIETLGRGYRPEQVGTYGRNIQLGDTRDRVRAIWGEHSGRSHQVVSNTNAVWQPNGQLAALAVATTRSVQIETWTYNFGPTRLMRRVVFEDGRVVRIETLDRGF